MLSIFSCACLPSVCLLWRKSLWVFCPFFDCWVIIYIELYELLVYFGYLPLFSHIVCKYFFPFHWLSFYVDGVLCCAKSFKFDAVQFIFVFLSFALEDWSKKIWLQFMFENVLPMYSFRNFMLGLTFRSLGSSQRGSAVMMSSMVI